MDDDSAQPWNLPPLDITGDGQFTIRDVPEWLLHLLFLPGDIAIALLSRYLPAVANFFSLGADDYGGTLSKSVSILAWIVAFVIVGLVINAIRNLDRTLTSYVLGRYEEGKRVLRIARRKLTSWIGMLRQRYREKSPGFAVGEVELEKLEAAVLRCYADIGEARVVAAADVAARLKVSLKQVQTALRQLTDYHLLAPAFGRDEGREGHHITQAGQIYLIEH